jgi:GT2 family glycosyltransferase
MSTPILSLVLAAGDDVSMAVTVSTVFRDSVDSRWELVIAGPQEPPDLRTLSESAPAGRLRWAKTGQASTSADDSSGTESDADAVALQAALEVTTGTYVGVLGSGDIVEPGVLPAVVEYLEGRPLVDVLYTDEQWPGTGVGGIFTKPGWNPEYLLGLSYFGRLCLVRRQLLVSCGGFRSGTAEVEEWDAHLRVTDAGAMVEHIPAVGVTRRAAPAVTADSTRAAVDVVQAHFARMGVEAHVEPADLPGSVRSWRTIRDNPLVSVIIPTIGGRREVRGEDLRLVTNCVRALLERTTYDHWELVLVTGKDTPQAAIDEVAALAGERLTVAPVDGDFNFSRSINEGARVARGELLLLLNDDTEVIEPRWLERMVGVAQDPTIAVVGAKLLFEDSRIQHLGVVHNDIWQPAHAFEFEQDDGAHFGMGTLDLDYLAVTGACLLTGRDVFADVGGLTVDLPLNFNDVDYCFKVIRRGLRVVCTPFAVLHHYESSTREARVEPYEMSHLHTQWRSLAYEDPFTNLREVR